MHQLVFLKGKTRRKDRTQKADSYYLFCYNTLILFVNVLIDIGFNKSHFEFLLNSNVVS